MQKARGGFTIIEVVLFVAISGFLIIGLMVGTSATVARQRYNDSVQDLAEFFRREYSAVVNPENGRTDPVDSKICLNENGSSSVAGTEDDIEGANRGRSGCLIYGRLITIGEVDDSQRIYSYDVIGRELGNYDATALKDALKLAAINVLVRSDPLNPTASGCAYKPVGAYQYTPQWLAQVEKTANSDRLKASILIVRSPVNGSVHTLIYNGTAIKVQDSIDTSCTTDSADSLLNAETIAKFTTTEDLDLCVGSDDILLGGGFRRSVRIGHNGHNSSAIVIVDQDSEENPCQQ